MGNINYMYYLVTTQRPLEEKMALFWHHVFATGNSKVDNYDQMLEQIDLFRKVLEPPFADEGLTAHRDLLPVWPRSPVEASLSAGRRKPTLVGPQGKIRGSTPCKANFHTHSHSRRSIRGSASAHDK